MKDLKAQEPLFKVPESFERMMQPQAEMSSNIMTLDDTNDLTTEQRELLFAVENNDGKKFVMLGGTTAADLNFPISKEGMSLLLVAAARGHTEMINFIFQNNNIDVNRTDRYGVNAFWIAAFYGHIVTMQVLFKHKVDIYARN